MDHKCSSPRRKACTHLLALSCEYAANLNPPRTKVAICVVKRKRRRRKNRKKGRKNKKEKREKRKEKREKRKMI